MLAPHAFVSAETTIESIVPEKLHDHPANPPARVTAEAIAGLMQSIDQYGQRDAVRVRTLNNPIGHFQILSGHRRAAASRLLGRAVDCIVVDADDHEAMREVMLGNAERSDLNPIERAELMQAMINAGVDRAEVGRMFGLESESGIKNTLRLMKLPKSIRSKVESGELPARAARALVPYAEATHLLDKLANQTDGWQWRTLIEHGKYQINDREVRPMDGKTKYSPGWEYQDAVRKFDVATLSKADRDRLQVVSLPIGKKGALVEVAQNTKLFDALNQPHIVKQSGYGGGAKVKAKKVDAAKMTPAELAAEAKRKAKEADARLAKRLPIWRRRLMRLAIANQTPPEHVAILVSLPWWIEQAGHELRYWIKATAATLGCPTGKPSSASDSLTLSIACMEPGNQVPMIDRLWRVLTWPQRLNWKVGPIAESLGTERVTIEPPQKMVSDRDFDRIDEQLDMIVKLADVSITGAWRDGAREGSQERELFTEFLGLHSTDQLRKLAKSWGMTPFDKDTKSFMIATITAKHTEKNPLPVPACLEVKAKGKR